MLSTSITVITVDLYTPKLSIVSEEYRADNVTVTVEWAQRAGVSYYTARLSPLAPSLFSGSTSHQQILLYNTVYILSVVAVTPCGNATALIGLHYGED